jgi:hypothetical protein
MSNRTAVALAFLQNSYYGNDRAAERMRETFARIGDDYRQRAYVIGYGVFAGCRTGRNLRRTFGTELCRHVIEWENASRFCGAQHGDDHGGADIDHVVAAINYWKPKAVIAFGAVAASAFKEIALDEGQVLIVGPHPARCSFDELLRMRKELEDACGY